MSVVDTDAWTCPEHDCGETVRGSKKHRKHHQKIHARRHGTPPQPSAPPPAPLRIPAAPQLPRRHR